MKVKCIASLCAALFFAPFPSVAQETLRLNVLEEFGTVSLARPALGCFDPVAALRFDDDAKSGALSGATEQAFAVGSCLALDSGTSLSRAQRAEVEDQRFIRGTLAGDGIVYVPEWGAALEGADDGYNSARAAVAEPMFAAAQALEDRIEATRQCAADTEALNARIADYNDRVAARGDSAEAPTTGSRLAGGGGAAPTLRIFLSTEKNRELRREGLSLKEEADSLERRCAAYREDFQLDRDYLAYHGIGA